MSGSQPDDLMARSLVEFARDCAEKTPTPGGGAVAAYTGALGASLARMAILYSLPGAKGEPSAQRDASLEQGIQWFETLREDLLLLADKDSAAYAAFSRALKLPKSTAEEKKARKKTVRQALEEALAVPLEAAAQCLEGLRRLEDLQAAINPRLITDLGVAARCLAAGARSCWYNVMVNARSLKQDDRLESISGQWKAAEKETAALERSISDCVDRELTSD